MDPRILETAKRKKDLEENDNLDTKKQKLEGTLIIIVSIQNWFKNWFLYQIPAFTMG